MSYLYGIYMPEWWSNRCSMCCVYSVLGTLFKKCPIGAIAQMRWKKMVLYSEITNHKSIYPLMSSSKMLSISFVISSVFGSGFVLVVTSGFFTIGLPGIGFVIGLGFVSGWMISSLTTGIGSFSVLVGFVMHDTRRRGRVRRRIFFIK